MLSKDGENGKTMSLNTKRNSYKNSSVPISDPPNSSQPNQSIMYVPAVQGNYLFLSMFSVRSRLGLRKNENIESREGEICLVFSYCARKAPVSKIQVQHWTDGFFCRNLRKIRF